MRIKIYCAFYDEFLEFDIPTDDLIWNKNAWMALSGLVDNYIKEAGDWDRYVAWQFGRFEEFYEKEEE